MPPPRITLPPGIKAPPAPGRPPSGLFPGSTQRPTYREPNPTRLGAVALGGIAGTVWMVLIGLLGHGARAYAWWTISAGILAWLAALGLARYGIRGIAVGVALASGVATAVVGAIVLEHWVAGHWILW